MFDSLLYLYLFQGGSNIVINSAGPVSNKTQSSRWLLFKNDRNLPLSDVRAVKLFKLSRLFHFYFTVFNFWLCLFRLKREPACTKLVRPSWDTTSVWARPHCPLPPRRFSSDLFTPRNPPAARAARKRETLDTTPTKKATKTWARPPPATARWQNLQSRTAAAAALPSPLVLPGLPAPRTSLPPPRSLGQQPAPETHRVLGLLLSAQSCTTSTSFTSWKEPLHDGVGAGSGSPLLQWKTCALASDVQTSGFLYECFLQLFLFLTTFYLFVCLAESVLTKAHPWWMFETRSQNVLGYIYIIFNDFSTEPEDEVDPLLFCWIIYLNVLSFKHLTTSSSSHILQNYLTLRGQSEKLYFRVF